MDLNPITGVLIRRDTEIQDTQERLPEDGGGGGCDADTTKDAKDRWPPPEAGRETGSGSPLGGPRRSQPCRHLDFWLWVSEPGGSRFLLS